MGARFGGGEPVLMRGEMRWLDNDRSATVLSYERTLGNSRVVTVINLAADAATVTVTGTGQPCEVLLSRGANLRARDVFSLEPYGYWVAKT